MTKVTADAIRSVINCYLLPPVALLGLIGNVLSLIILGGKKMRQFISSISSFLSVLNSSANFVVYIVMNKKFSDILYAG
ncbi:uncharacterized protein LOC126824500 [Patella vulgata]|uniref:uncharacterized protein LOC126824500 n=1 Tax=Patella vulgata TaxID=6465 RepID=UPI0024A8A613|nr:uncharacterized protein LOC126824500 [Patella vulgata]